MPRTELGPAPASWLAMPADPRRDPRCRAAREELGLDADRPIIVTGHQAQFWHAGIAAKLFAARSLAARVDGQVVWLVVDTDTNDPFRIEAPVRDAAGRLRVGPIDLAGPPPGLPVPTASLPAKRPVSDPLGGQEPGLDALPSRLARMRDRLAAAHADASSAAEQVTRAALAMLPGPMPKTVYASALAETTAFAELVGRALDDPDGIAEHYNNAVRAHPTSGVQVLNTRNGVQELPFWIVSDAGGRKPATVNDDPDARRWPRALSMTGLVRAFVCDLFIHGTGGRAYEPINDAWLPGVIGATLAPAVTATATLTPRFDDAPAVTQNDAAQAAWRAHHARHHPEALGDNATQRQRDAFVRKIRGLPRNDRGRAELYASLQACLDAYRAAHREALRVLADEAREASASADESAVRLNRTFPAALLEETDLQALADEIDAAFERGAP